MLESWEIVKLTFLHLRWQPAIFAVNVEVIRNSIMQGSMNTFFLPVGLFDPAVAIHPQENWYASTKLNWISDCNNLPEYEELPNG